LILCWFPEKIAFVDRDREPALAGLRSQPDVWFAKCGWRNRDLYVTTMHSTCPNGILHLACFGFLLLLAFLTYAEDVLLAQRKLVQGAFQQEWTLSNADRSTVMALTRSSSSVERGAPVTLMAVVTVGSSPVSPETVPPQRHGEAL